LSWEDKLLKRKTPSAEPMAPDPDTELEFISDSPEYLAYTIEYIGYRNTLDQASQAAIARAKSGQNDRYKYD